MTRALVFTGADRYDGRWHDHAATSQCIAALLATTGVDAAIRATHPRSFGELASADVLIVNAAYGAGCSDDASDADWDEAFAALCDAVAAGMPVLAIHQSSASFAEYPPWREWLGGGWAVGTSMHPPLDVATIHVHTNAHPITAAFDDFTVADERYCVLDTHPDNIVLASHRYEGIEQPIVWARRQGMARVVHDALGHDTRSYDSPGRRDLLLRSVAWLLGQR